MTFFRFFIKNFSTSNPSSKGYCHCACDWPLFASYNSSSFSWPYKCEFFIGKNGYYNFFYNSIWVHIITQDAFFLNIPTLFITSGCLQTTFSGWKRWFHYYGYKCSFSGIGYFCSSSAMSGRCRASWNYRWEGEFLI